MNYFSPDYTSQQSAAQQTRKNQFLMQQQSQKSHEVHQEDLTTSQHAPKFTFNKFTLNSSPGNGMESERGYDFLSTFGRHGKHEQKNSAESQTSPTHVFKFGETAKSETDSGFNFRYQFFRNWSTWLTFCNLKRINFVKWQKNCLGWLFFNQLTIISDF